MNQHSRFNLPLCLCVEEEAFSRTDEILASYLPDIKGQKAIIISEKFLVDTYPDVVNSIRDDFGGAEIYEMGMADFDEAVAIAKKICIEDMTLISHQFLKMPPLPRTDIKAN